MRQQENLQLGIPHETAKRFPRRLQELCGYSVYKGQFGHIDNRDPIELLGRERGKRMVWEATDARKARAGKSAKQEAHDVVSGRCDSIEPGISRFRVRPNARPGMTGENYPTLRNRR